MKTFRQNLSGNRLVSWKGYYQRFIDKLDRRDKNGEYTTDNIHHFSVVSLIAVNKTGRVWRY